MRTYIYTNEYGDTITFDYTKDYGISDITGLGALTIKDVTTQGYKQDGNRLEYSQLDTRPVEVRLWIECMNAEDYKAARELIFKVFRAKTVGTLFIQDDITGLDLKLECHVTGTPDMPEDGIYTVTDGYVDLEANDPRILDRKEKVLELTSWEGGFSCPTKTRFKCRHRGAPVASLNNDGHLDIPVRVEFSGPATNPIIRNLTTGEYIAINDTLAAGEKIVITTDYDNKTITKVSADGTETTAETAITDASDFIWLVNGVNNLKYGSDSAEQINRVIVYYRRAFEGV